MSRTNALKFGGTKSLLGRVFVAYGERGIACLNLAASAEAFARACEKEIGVRPVPDPSPPAGLLRRVVAAIEGAGRFRGSFDLSGLTPFQRRVLDLTAEIPRGEVRSYQWIAREIGAPAAMRAVGTALARNPVPFLIPCHRVVRADGRIGEYSAGGPSMKTRILTLEGVDVQRLQEVARGLRFCGSRKTRIFCLPTCRSIRPAREPLRVYFRSGVEARRAGFRACKLCRPA